MSRPSTNCLPTASCWCGSGRFPRRPAARSSAAPAAKRSSTGNCRPWPSGSAGISQAASRQVPRRQGGAPPEEQAQSPLADTERTDRARSAGPRAGHRPRTGGEPDAGHEHRRRSGTRFARTHADRQFAGGDVWRPLPGGSAAADRNVPRNGPGHREVHRHGAARRRPTSPAARHADGTGEIPREYYEFARMPEYVQAQADPGDAGGHRACPTRSSASTNP